ncbi:hypothetical protein HanIR_Chr01g0004251 [Helianthus annuus]|nr:hypothetical protein HanIR_Chr01g0004251 [Helianthus annuus]
MSTERCKSNKSFLFSSLYVNLGMPLLIILSNVRVFTLLTGVVLYRAVYENNKKKALCEIKFLGPIRKFPCIINSSVI